MDSGIFIGRSKSKTESMAEKTKENFCEEALFFRRKAIAYTLFRLAYDPGPGFTMVQWVSRRDLIFEETRYF